MKAAMTAFRLAPMTPPLGAPTAPALGLAEAAKACGVSESTIRRKRPELLAAGATQTSKGWSIPIPVLVELGLMDRTTAPDTPDNPPVPAQEPVTTAPTPSPSDSLLEALREKLAEAEKRAAVAEAVAAERERIIEAQALALRMLEAPKQPAEEQQPQPLTRVSQAPAPEPPQEQPNRLRRLLQKALG